MHGEAPALADPPDMGVDDHARHAEDAAEDHVGRLAAHTVELQQLLHRLRHDPAEFLLERPGHPNDGQRLLMVETRRLDVAFEFGQVRRGELRGGLVAREQHRGDLVDLHVGALRGQDRRHKQLQRVSVLERQARDRVALAKKGGDLRRPCARPGQGLASGESNRRI